MSKMLCLSPGEVKNGVVVRSLLFVLHWNLSYKQQFVCSGVIPRREPQEVNAAR